MKQALFQSCWLKKDYMIRGYAGKIWPKRTTDPALELLVKLMTISVHVWSEVNACKNKSKLPQKLQTQKGCAIQLTVNGKFPVQGESS